MDGTGWRPLRGVDRGHLREARLRAHHAMQWLARAARACIPARPDDAHTNLGWDDRLDGFTTRGRQAECVAFLRAATDGAIAALN